MLEQKLQPNQNSITLLQVESINLLKQLIEIPSLSKEEDKTADAIIEFLQQKQIEVFRSGNNVWALNKYYNSSLPTILLNSHHDTVKPNAGYTFNPFEAIVQDGKLYGLGSNDAGGSLVSLLAVFIYFYEQTGLKYNIIYSATAEEEISGRNGVASILPQLGKIDFAIVGEPTQMNLAIAEKGLLVIDCVAHGTSSHAAHQNPDNAIINVLSDLKWFRDYEFPRKSEFLGAVKMSVTMINAGTQHNVIPDTCHYTVDIRTNDKYSNEEVLAIIKQNVKSDITPRSLHLNSSSISVSHPFVQSGISLGCTVYGSPTSSDMAVMNFPSVKIGPGNSLRSHSSDEFIFLEEIENGITKYIDILSKIIL